MDPFPLILDSGKKKIEHAPPIPDLCNKNKHDPWEAWIAQAYKDLLIKQQSLSASASPSAKPAMPMPNLEPFAKMQQELAAQHAQLWQSMLQFQRVGIKTEGIKTQILGLDSAVKIKLERRLRAQDASRKKEKFVPSDELSRFVLLADERAPREGRHTSLTEAEALSRKEHIANCIFGLLQTIADSLPRQGKRQYKVASERRFEDAFSKALFFRINVAVYGQTPFLDTLFGELSSSDVSANNWRLNSDEPGSLVLDVDAATPRSDRIARKRATPVRLKMTQFSEVDGNV